MAEPSTDNTVPADPTAIRAEQRELLQEHSSKWWKKLVWAFGTTAFELQDRTVMEVAIEAFQLGQAHGRAEREPEIVECINRLLLEHGVLTGVGAQGSAQAIYEVIEILAAIRDRETK